MHDDSHLFYTFPHMEMASFDVLNTSMVCRIVCHGDCGLIVNRSVCGFLVVDTELR